MERLWLAPTFAIVSLLILGPLLAYFHVVPGLAGFSLVLLAVLVGVVFGIGLAAASAFATVTNKPWRPRSVRAAIVPLLVGLPILALASMSKVPAIHDISTDLENRIEFTPDVAAASSNQDPPAEQRAIVEGLQKSGYPDIAPVVLALPADQAFVRAKAVAEKMPGWNVTHADAETGRIEATATSKLFHFVDDIAIRVRPDGAGSRVDLRSRSRVGQSDLGANAARIRAFSAELVKPS
ncbi:MAG TPA: DUF1499 domain-containing protein [Myxococcota bacterium]|nr:DUF1499 domain-containing protein [Myxococcota bacterium]